MYQSRVSPKDATLGNSAGKAGLHAIKMTCGQFYRLRSSPEGAKAV